MSQYPICPCCSYGLINRFGAEGAVWFCPHCYQEMPVSQEMPGLDVSDRGLSEPLTVPKAWKRPAITMDPQPMNQTPIDPKPTDPKAIEPRLGDMDRNVAPEPSQDRTQDRIQDRMTLGEIIDGFIFSCPAPLYGQALSRPVVRRYLVDYVLKRVQWELPPDLLRVDETQPDAAAQDAIEFRQYVECAISWGMEEIIRDRLDLTLVDDASQDASQNVAA